ncbi:hypothetical protein J3Q64DRAFT_1708304 [Phycomyces blakesleeanus]|uniref:Ras-GEF domain-containing protein n=1 Tax=Phycomyces blakesleeanus TaxID=4837 RepID=A0ABR3BCI2_PHYBL
MSSSLPSIPVSPFIKALLQCASTLAQATKDLSEASARPPTTIKAKGELTQLSQLVQSQRNWIDDWTMQMHSVQGVMPSHWDADIMARQIASIDSQLFDLVVLDQTSLLHIETRQSKWKPVLDFHRYLSHSFSHQLIYFSGNPTESDPETHLVAYLVRVAYLLLNTYRDFSGFAAIVYALQSPAVRRLHSLWKSCPSLSLASIDEYLSVLSPENTYEAYHKMLHNTLVPYYTRDQTTTKRVAVPWVEAHVGRIALNQRQGDRKNVNRQMSITLGILELCQRNTSTQPAAWIEEALNFSGTLISPPPLPPPSKGSSSSYRPFLDNALANIPALDLRFILPENSLVYHWIVSRVYMSDEQLMEESFAAERPVSAPIMIQSAEEILEELGLEEMEVDADVDNQETEEVRREEIFDEEVLEEDEVQYEAQQQEEVIEGDEGLFNDYVPLSVIAEQEEEYEDDVVMVAGGSSVDQTIHAQQFTDSTVGKSLPIVYQENSAPQVIDETQPHTDMGTAATTSVNNDIPKSADTKSETQIAETVKEHQDDDKNKEEEEEEEEWRGYPVSTENDDEESEKWEGYIGSLSNTNLPNTSEDKEDVWTGYREPSDPSSRRESSLSEASAEWKGYCATSEEAKWEAEARLKVEEKDWQGYTLETLPDSDMEGSLCLDSQDQRHMLHAKFSKDLLSTIPYLPSPHK